MKTVKDETLISSCTEYYASFSSIVNSPYLKRFQDNHQSYQSFWPHSSNVFPAEFKDTSSNVLDTNVENIEHVTSNDSNIDIKKTLSKREDIDIAAKKIFQSLRNYPFEQGYNSFADIELMSLKNEMSEADFYILLPKIWMFCYSSRSTIESLHFLNCLLNLSKDIDSDAFCFCGVAAISHRNLEIKEAGIALFEKMRSPKYCSILENVGTTGVEWLDQYRLDVISELKELL
jgi:hypothetical protein